MTREPGRETTMTRERAKETMITMRGQGKQRDDYNERGGQRNNNDDGAGWTDRRRRWSWVNRDTTRILEPGVQRDDDE